MLHIPFTSDDVVLAVKYTCKPCSPPERPIKSLVGQKLTYLKCMQCLGELNQLVWQGCATPGCPILIVRITNHQVKPRSATQRKVERWQKVSKL